MRLIDADALKEAVNNKKVVGRFNTIQLIDNAPTVDIPTPTVNIPNYGGRVVPDTLHGWRYEERPQGEWIEESSETGALGIKYTWVRCNQCGWNNSLVIPKNFCPNCGADMRGDKNGKS